MFNPAAHPLLERVELGDSALGPILDGLSRRPGELSRPWINYRDLSVQHLGSIYEKLLEYAPVIENDKIIIGLNPFARKGSGSYYTPEGLVHLILDGVIGPLIKETEHAFTSKARTLATSKRPIKERLDTLRPLDPASTILDFKICDPAMGSGHFLVSLVDYLADAVLRAMADAAASVQWAREDAPYLSPLAVRISSIRDRILKEAKRKRWKIEEDHLDDRHIVRRMILKRSVFGVDKNPMAVELAKVSLWLNTFTVGAPLSFLDHHLRCGDSLFGEFTRDALDEGGGLQISPYVQQAKHAAKGMAAVEESTDADIAEVRASRDSFANVGEETAALRAWMDFVHARRWRSDDLEWQRISDQLLSGGFGHPVPIIARSAIPKGTRDQISAVERILADGQAFAAREHFLHWEVSFPGVWANWESGTPEGGFDAVIGNPPWDKVELDEKDWFEARYPKVARAQNKDARKALINELRDSHPSISADFDLASNLAQASLRTLRKLRQYPHFSKGRPDLYALFVERAIRLTKPNGIVGLLVPSGIYGDKQAGSFILDLINKRRLGAIIEFENLRKIFPDIDRREKFSIFIAGGERRSFATSNLGFRIKDVKDAMSTLLSVPAETLVKFNPNSGNLPSFSGARDIEIAADIHNRLPILALRTSGGWKRQYPIRSMQMLNMSTDAHLFKTPDELIKDGFYQVAPNKMKRGKESWLPLYEGKIVGSYNHRASNIIMNMSNRRRPAQEVPATFVELSNPKWSPSFQYYVSKGSIPLPPIFSWFVAFKDITAATNTRTAIASIIPFAGAGHTLPIIIPDFEREPRDGTEDDRAQWLSAVREKVGEYSVYAPFVLANFNSLIFDYLCRQKVQGEHLG